MITSFFNRFHFYGILVMLAISPACDSNQEADNSTSTTQTYFKLLDSVATQVGFVNRVEDQDEFNVLTYRNFYNGGGVAIGDINNDGLPDLYFTANLDKNRLYLNTGDLTFEDITTKAGVAGTRAWSTGVIMADVNGDGWLDIYVSNSGDVQGDNKENELFINNRDLTFREAAKEWGLDNNGYSTTAGFFDYDLDGDLDCYLLNNSFKDPSRIELFRSMRDKPDELGGDKLYRNDGSTFTDVTIEAGIYSSEIGFGLGAAIGDLNLDGYPDIYVSNDFWERDYLYLNQGDGTFSEELIDRIDFCSISSMGGDIADVNNDGFPEIISTDMLATDNYRLKAMSAFDPYHLENLKYRANYHYQIGQNCLHLNDGQANFQEVGMLSGVAATDWSWGALFFDFNNNGRKDLFVSNGIQRDLMYMDFRDFLVDNAIYNKIATGAEIDYPSIISQMPSNPISNFALINEDGIHFSNFAADLGLAQPSFSNGSAYGDLDNDGDLDLVVNNVNMPAFIYQNQAENTGNQFIKIKFQGYGQNPFGIGAKVELISASERQVYENFNTRGFQSSIEPQLCIGLGQNKRVDELTVTWPDGKLQKLSNIPVGEVLILDHKNAATPPPAQDQKNTESIFVDVTNELFDDNARHTENLYNDFDHEVLLFRMLSTEGPKLIKGDINGDGLTDFILPGAHQDADKLFLQNTTGQFELLPNADFEGTKVFETTCGALFDHDQDGDLDLVLGSGGNESRLGNEFFALRYFENEGAGNFKLNQSEIPQILGNFSCIVAEDFDEDGDIDLFVGARTIPGNYGLPPRNYLLIRESTGWRDGTDDRLSGAGMITDAAWADVDGDDDKDLIIVGDWMAVQIFKNYAPDRLLFHSSLPDSEGWWNTLAVKDLDGDGHSDIVAGNWGLNSKFKATPQEPLTMFVNDFDQNGKSEFIINWHPPADQQAYPFATKMELTEQLPNLRKSVLKYEQYASQQYEDLFSPEIRASSIPYRCIDLQSSIFWNEGESWQKQSLPWQAQVAPVFAIEIADFDKNGYQDIWMGGNFYALKPQVGRCSAGRGVLLQNLDGRNFEALYPGSSGISVMGEVRDASFIESSSGPVFVVARNNNSLLAFRPKREGQVIEQ